MQSCNVCTQSCIVHWHLHATSTSCGYVVALLQPPRHGGVNTHGTCTHTRTTNTKKLRRKREGTWKGSGPPGVHVAKKTRRRISGEDEYGGIHGATCLGEGAWAGGRGRRAEVDGQRVTVGVRRTAVGGRQSARYTTPVAWRNGCFDWREGSEPVAPRLRELDC